MKIIGKIIEFFSIVIVLAAAIFIICWFFFRTSNVLNTYTATVTDVYTQDTENWETDANGTNRIITTHYYVICDTGDGYTITIDDKDTYQKYKNKLGSEITISQKETSLFGFGTSVYWEESE